MFNVFCPYGNAYPEHSTLSISITFLSTMALLLILAYTGLLYFHNEKLTKKQIALLSAMFIFVLITFFLNLYYANW